MTAQKAIDFSLISEINPSVEAVSIELKRFSYQPYVEDPFIVLIIGFFPFVILMSFMFTVIFTAKEIVQEKETGLKEAMKLMGMSPWVYWLSWYIRMQILLFPSLILMIISYKVKLPLKNLDSTASIINKTDPIIFALFLFLYSSGFSTFTLVCSTLFKKSNNAAAGSGIIFFISYMPNIIVSLRYEMISLPGKIFLAFFNNLAMSMGVQLIGIFEAKGYGINFSNITSGISIQDSFSMAHVMFILFLSNFLHIFLIYYFDNLFPGDHGIAKPWHFIFSRFFSSKSSNEIIKNKKVNEGQDFFENESIYSERKIGIRIKNLYKEFKQLGQKKTAVENLNLNIYQGQITVLLGHNGAGKR